MPLRTVSNTGGNWNATSAWVGGVVPIAGDTVDFTATSGNLVVNVVTAVLTGINFTNYVGTITFNNPISTSGAVNLGTGGYTQAGASGLVLTGTATITSNGTVWSRNLSFTGTSITYTLADTLSTTGVVSFSGSSSTILNGNTLNIGGTLTNTTAAGVSGTTAIVFNGTNCIWSNSSLGVIRSNTTVNTSGTLTISGTVRFDGSTFTYIAGTVNSAGSTLITAANTTFNTTGMTWGNVTLGGVITLTSNMTVGGNLTTLTATATINGVSRTLYVGGNLTISITTNGTANIELIGTGTMVASAAYLYNNLIFNNGANTFTVSGVINYAGGTITYTSGTIVTTGSTLSLGNSATLNTNGMSWNNFFISTSVTATLTSNMTILGNFTAGGGGGGNVGLNGATLYVGGNFVANGSSGAVYALIGTGTVVMNGTGTWSGPFLLVVQVNLTIDTLGTVTISGGVAYSTGTLTYVQGNVITTNSILYFLSHTTTSTLNTSGMVWNHIFAQRTVTLNLLSNLNTDILSVNYRTPVNNPSPNTTSLTFTGTGELNVVSTLNIGNGEWTLASNGDATCTLNLNNPITVPTLNVRLSGGRNTLFVYAVYNAVINNHSVTVTDKISTLVTSVGLPLTPLLTGTSEIIMKGSTWTIQGNSTAGVIDTVGMPNGCGSNLTIDTPYLNFTTNLITNPDFVYSSNRTFKCLSTRVKTNLPLLVGTGPTLLNMNNIPWKKVTVVSGITVTMNEFFTGAANYKVPVIANSTTNYNITFTDSFEKTTKFVEISNCTLTRPNQLIVLGDCRAKGTNRGIRYTNQSPNGLPKFLTKTNPSMTFDTAGLIPDPNFVKLI